MRETRVANRYANALFEFAIEMKMLEEIRSDMELLLTVCRENREFLLMLKSPVIKEAKKQSILKSIFEGKINDLTFKFLKVITHNRREEVIMEISEQFIKIYKEFMNILPTTLTSAVKLDAGTRDKIVTLLGDRTNTEIELSEQIREEIIGGFILEFEDKQYDASVLRKIKNLRKEFDVNLYIKGF
jgi:F-type H+-transporting ATPase subunit delta